MAHSTGPITPSNSQNTTLFKIWSALDMNVFECICTASNIAATLVRSIAERYTLILVQE